MLVEINTQVGGVSTDARTRFFNFMSCLHAVATAAAGSTPVVNPVNTSGVKNTSHNCITVLSNAEAGGWSTGTSNNITASTTYTQNSSTNFVCDLWKASGKTTFPYYRVSFAQQYPFNSSFDSYPYMYSWCGSTASDPATTAYTADTTWRNNSSGFNNSSSSFLFNTQPTSQPAFAYPRVDVDFAGYADAVMPHKRIYIACASNYLIIATPFDMWYFGQRTISPWELQRTDNPPWVSFGWAGGMGNYPGYYSVGSHPISTHYHAWSSAISPDLNTVHAASKFGFGYLSGNASTYNMTLTGYNSNYTGLVSMQGTNSSQNGLLPATHPMQLFEGSIGSTINTLTWGRNFRNDTMVTDPTTGLQVPPAYPLVVQGGKDYSTGTPATTFGSFTGTMFGVLRGPSTSVAGYNAMLTASEYTIGSSTYIPLRFCHGSTTPSQIGPQDCYFIRKA